MIIEITLLFLTTIPTAYLLHKLTIDEIKYTKYYLKLLSWPIAIIAAILFSINLQNALTATYFLITIIIWQYFNQTSKKKK